MLLSPAAPSTASARGLVSVRRTRVFALAEARWAATALVLFLAGLTTQFSDGPAWLRWSCYLACYATGGWEPAWAGLRALRAKTLDVDLLMVAAAIGAAAIGQVLDGGLLIVIFATSGALEALATARTEDSVRGLLDLAPETANRLGPDGTELVLVDTLAVGDLVLVRPGERLPADGTVLDGAGEVDQATITGEALPVDKLPGDGVFAGTINGTGALRIRVDRSAGDSVVARIASLVEQASRTKANTQLFIEKVEQRYSVGMVAATVLLFAIPLLAGQSLTESLLRAMTFMIVASPCAVVLATMPPLLAAIATAGRHGVLVKSAVVMEGLGATTVVAFDKTGTLTRGTPKLAEIRPFPGHDGDEALRLAAAAEQPSEHPLAAAIVHAARERDLDLPAATDFVARPGRGVAARVRGELIEVTSPASAGIEHTFGSGTVVVVSRAGTPVAALSMTDQIREEAAGAVATLTALTGTAPVLLTGDNRATADEVANRVGIADVRAELLPEDKVAAVDQLTASGRRVTVVGDGINDAPALTAAHTGIAMGGRGADLTLHAADAVIVRDDLSTIASAIALSRRARRVVTANLIIASVFIAGLVAWDLVGHLPLPLGVAGHEGSTVIVGLNGLRLLRNATWRR